jgi:hypothetical protein
MNRKLAFLLFALLILFLVAILGITYYLINNTDVKVDRTSFQNRDTTKLIFPDSGGWVEKLTNTKLQNYSLPATEISLKLSLNDENIKKYKYRVLVENINQIQFFNLTQILKNNNIDYSYFKQESTIRVIILTDSKTILDELLNSLEDYSIEYILQK